MSIFRVRFIVQGVHQTRSFDNFEKAKGFWNALRASPEVDRVYDIERL